MNIVRLEGFQRIYYVDGFLGEYESLFSNAEDLHRYLKKLRTNLKMLDEDGIQTSQDSNRKFEKLENTSLFCIRHVSKMNPRVVFCVLEAEFGFLLLVPFLEKDTNKDYKRAIARAKGMLEKLGESIWEN